MKYFLEGGYFKKRVTFMLTFEICDIKNKLINFKPNDNF